MHTLTQKFRCLLAGAALVLCGAAPYAAASVIVVDNGAANHLTGNNKRTDAPGAVVARGSYDGLQEYRNDFALNAPLMLAPGTYWLVLHNGGPRKLRDPDEFLRESAADNNTSRGVERFARSGPWSTTGTEHAFQVSAVPEPEQVLMLLIGMMLLACQKRRDQRSANFN